MLHTDSRLEISPASTATALTETAVKVLLIASSPHAIGGQSIQAKGMVENLTRDSLAKVGFVPTNPRLNGILAPVERVPYLRTLITSLKFGFSLFKIIPHFDVVHVFSGGGTSYVISTLPPLFFAKLFRKKVVLNYHSGELDEHINRWRWLMNPTLKHFDAIVVPSKFLVDIFSKRGFVAEAIPNFVDEKLFSFKERREISPRFLSTRNLEPHYNVACILRAFWRIQSEIPKASLAIAGDGSEKSSLLKLAAEMNLRNVDFLGGVSREKTSELYRENDIFLNSSDIDNMPLSIMEAFASGTAVVTTGAGGISYLVRDGETGFLVAKNDDEALANTALRLLKEPGLAQRVTANAHQVAQKYSWKQIRDSWIALYARLIKESRQG